MKNTLIIDIGNSSVTVTEFEPASGASNFRGTRNVVNRRSVLHNERWDTEGIRTILGASQPEKVAVCSVVPGITEIAMAAVAATFGLEAVLASNRSPWDLDIRYDDIDRLGTDRIASASGARSIFPDSDIIVIDLGTATTVDAVSREGFFSGGVIVPGPGTWLASLASLTAQLPEVAFPEGNVPVAGRNTRDCIASGIAIGYPAMLSGLIRKLTETVFSGRKPLVVATGGWANAFENDRLFDTTNPDLVALGVLNLVGNQLTKEKSCALTC